MILKALVKTKNENQIKSYLKLKSKFSSKDVNLIVKECIMGNLVDIITIITIIDSTGYEFSWSNKDGLTKVICETKDAEKIYWFVCHVKNLSKNNISDLTKAMCKTKNPYYIYCFACDVKNLTEDNINNLTKAMCKTKNPYYIYCFACDVKNLTEDNINNLTKAMCETKDVDYICLFARKVKNLTEDNINNLTKAMCETKDAYYIYYFACDVKNLTEGNINDLTKAICETKDVDYICFFARKVKNLTENNKKTLIKVICEITTFEKLGSIMLKHNLEYVILSEQFKNRIIESKDKYLIAQYIILTNDTELMNKIFDDLLLFESFCIINKNSINVSDEKMVTFLSKNLNNNFKYVDDNIEDYIKDNLNSKKLEHK